MTKTFTIRGEKLRCGSLRRFIVVTCRPADFEGRRWDYLADPPGYVPETYQAFKPRIVKRSDSYETAKKESRKYGPAGGWCVVIDTVTGEEV